MSTTSRGLLARQHTNKRLGMRVKAPLGITVEI
jgi:hypothetical protein